MIQLRNCQQFETDSLHTQNAGFWLLLKIKTMWPQVQMSIQQLQLKPGSSHCPLDMAHVLFHLRRSTPFYWALT